MGGRLFCRMCLHVYLMKSLVALGGRHHSGQVRVVQLVVFLAGVIVVHVFCFENSIHYNKFGWQCHVVGEPHQGPFLGERCQLEQPILGPNMSNVDERAPVKRRLTLGYVPVVLLLCGSCILFDAHMCIRVA